VFFDLGWIYGIRWHHVGRSCAVGNGIVEIEQGSVRHHAAMQLGCHLQSIKKMPDEPQAFLQSVVSAPLLAEVNAAPDSIMKSLKTRVSELLSAITLLGYSLEPLNFTKDASVKVEEMDCVFAVGEACRAFALVADASSDTHVQQCSQRVKFTFHGLLGIIFLAFVQIGVHEYV
jgi:hypothetical protein